MVLLIDQILMVAPDDELGRPPKRDAELRRTLPPEKQECLSEPSRVSLYYGRERLRISTN